jgi:hypothetical protein
MKAKLSSDGEKLARDALKALRRAAKKAVELGPPHRDTRLCPGKRPNC